MARDVGARQMADAFDEALAARVAQADSPLPPPSSLLAEASAAAGTHCDPGVRTSGFV
jgi:hypothetical protein